MFKKCSDCDCSLLAKEEVVCADCKDSRHEFLNEETAKYEEKSLAELMQILSDCCGEIASINAQNGWER